MQVGGQDAHAGSGSGAAIPAVASLAWPAAGCGWVFLINAPAVVVGMLATLALIPQSRAGRRPTQSACSVPPPGWSR